VSEWNLKKSGASCARNLLLLLVSYKIGKLKEIYCNEIRDVLFEKKITKPSAFENSDVVEWCYFNKQYARQMQVIAAQDASS
jgi:hypothetical protein